MDTNENYKIIVPSIHRRTKQPVGKKKIKIKK
jgi:hypothetical protein